MKFLPQNKGLSILTKLCFALVLLAIMFLATCYGLGKIILNANRCEAFMIDNTEVHTHINVPKIKTIDCNYQPKDKRKRIYFVIDKAEEHMPQYISFSTFKKLNDFEIINTADFYRYNRDTFLQQQVKLKSLFYKSHTYTDGEYYKALLDSSTGQVWINIDFVQ